MAYYGWTIINDVLTFSNITIAVGGVAKFADGTAAAPSITFTSQPTTGLYLLSDRNVALSVTQYPTLLVSRTGSRITIDGDYELSWSSSSGDATTAGDVKLFRDAAGILALKNSTNAQTFRIYGGSDFWTGLNTDATGNFNLQIAAIPPGAPTTALSGTAGTLNTGSHTWKVTFVTPGGESDGGTVSAAVSTVDALHSADLSAIPKGSAFCTSRNIYRNKIADQTHWFLVTTIANNTATTYNDGAADSALTTAIPTANTAIDTYLKAITTTGNTSGVTTYAADGTAAAPSWAEASTSSHGLYWAGTGILGFSWAGTAKIFLIGDGSGDSGWRHASDVRIGWTSGTVGAAGNDTYLARVGVGQVGIFTDSTHGVMLDGGTTDGTLSIKTRAVADTAILNVNTIATTGKYTTYNGKTTAGWGVEAVNGYGDVAAVTNTGTASIATYTPTADGTFRVSANCLVTTSTNHTFSLDCTYTDEGNVARTLILPITQLTGVFSATNLITNVTGTGPYESAVMTIRAKASTAITIRTSAGGTFTGVVYNARGVITQVG